MKLSSRECFVIFFLLCCVSFINCYNVDTVNYVKHSILREEMFGFSVAAHKEHGQSWVLVGAPRAQSRQRGVSKGGLVYKCDTGRSDSCEEVIFDREGDNTNQGIPVDKKSDQWFGATLHSAGENGPVVACAPRYIWYTMRSDQRRDPVGTCFIARNNFRNVSEYSPCRTSQWGYHRQGSCQAGFSAAISKDGRRLFIGAPGSWYWQGQMYSINANAHFRFLPRLYGTFGAGQVINPSIENRAEVFQTPEGDKSNDDSYMGYSVALGDFNGEGFQGIAAGMPRGDELRGKVQLYTWNLTNFKNITGTQLGSYFGYSVAAGDIDGDKLDDLIIGAPMFTLPNNEAKYEVGRVYVIYQRSNEGSFRRIHELDGYNSKSRFGLCVASLGDINLDGYGDFAVGAPYDGPNERGAVYIFHGSNLGVRKKFSQKIASEDFGIRPAMKTFGFSISGGVDLDNNDYPDTIIGAYSSNTVYYLRSRPVAKINGHVKFFSLNKEIDLEHDKTCTLRDGQAVPCATFETCFEYYGVGVPRAIDLDVEFVLDAKKTAAHRMYFLDTNRKSLNNSWYLEKEGRVKCQNHTVYVKNDIRDKLNPLEVEVRYSMRAQRYASGQLHPILDLTEPPVKRDSITVHKNCGFDKICIPDLSLNVKPNFERYLLGSKEKLVLDIIVENMGEDSFETTFQVQLPEGVDFNKVVELDQKEVRVSCTAGTNNTIYCDVGNPLGAKTIAHFKMEFKPYHKEGMSPSYDFLMKANSTNPEKPLTMGDNLLNVSIPIYVNSTLHIHGKTKPSEIRYNMTYYPTKTVKQEVDIGPQVIHVYNIKNEGPSTINETEILFVWPSNTESGDDLMYLLEQPEVLGKVVCGEADDNYKEYLIQAKKTIWEALETEVTKTEISGQEDVTGYEGVKVEEGSVIIGKQPEFVGNTTSIDYSGRDASFVHEQRQKQHQEGHAAGGSSGTTVHVTEDKGHGDTVHTITYNRTTPIVTTSTYWKNTTTIYGPDGKIIKQDVAHGGKPPGSLGYGAGQYGTSEERYYSGGQTHTSGGQTHSSSGQTHTSGGQTHASGGQIHSSGAAQDRYGQGHQTYSSGAHGASQGQDRHYTGGQTQTSGGSAHTYSGGSQYGTSQERHYGSGQTQTAQDRYGGRTTEHRTTGDRRYQGGQYDEHTSQQGYGTTHGQSHQSREQTYQSGYEEETKPNIYDNAYSSEEITDQAFDDLTRSRHNSSSSGGWQSGYESSRQGGSAGRQGSSQGSETHGYGQTQHQGAYGEQNRQFEEDYASHGIGAAALDHGFKTGGFEVNSLGNRNVDETVSKQAGAHMETHHSDRTYDPDLGWISTAQSGSAQQARGQQQGANKQWVTSWSTSSNQNFDGVERDNVDTERPDYTRRHLGRKKRQTINLTAARIEDVIECQASKCKFVKCIAGPLKKDEDFTVGFRWRVDVQSLQNISSDQPIEFSSMAFARISKVPYIGSPLQKTVFKHEIITTILPPEPDVSPSVVPLWVVVLSAVAGVIILLLLAFLLYKCGFFKRNRVSDAPERQPLNRNGHYNNGDEAL